MPNYKLVYFNGKGRGETTRLAFHYGGIKFEDCRIEKADWPELKPKTMTGRLPYLVVDGKELTESLAIARFAGREAGIAGKSNFEQTVIDSLMSIINDLAAKGINVMFCNDESLKPALKKEFIEKDLMEYGKILEKFVGDKTFLTSDQISLADLNLYAYFDFMDTVFQDIPWRSRFPKLAEISDRVASDPRLSEYFKNRPKTEF